MFRGTVICSAEQVTASRLSQVLAQDVVRVRISAGHGNWSQQLAITAQMADGTVRALRLKICLGPTFGRSEVDYYTRDYIALQDAPLVRCLDAQYDPALGYHILLEDLTASHWDRRDALPSLAYGRAVAGALGRMHGHHWESKLPPDDAALDRYFDESRPGLAPMEAAMACPLRERFDRHELAFRARWRNPRGMSLLHGDLNPTNILTPRGAESPVQFLDRQPFDWSLTYGVAVSDLAYFMIPWWPELARREWGHDILRHWYESLGKPDYSWNEAQMDWALSVEQCLNVPLEWCAKAATFDSMRGLWEAQFARIQDALADPTSQARPGP